MHPLQICPASPTKFYHSYQISDFQQEKRPVTHFLPWVPEVFLACGWNFRCWPKGHYKDLTETGNRARKVSGTQGTHFLKVLINNYIRGPECLCCSAFFFFKIDLVQQSKLRWSVSWNLRSYSLDFDLNV